MVAPLKIDDRALLHNQLCALSSPNLNTLIAKDPSNVAAMGTPPRYTYTSLPSQYIRVLELHPGLSDAPLECDVVVQQIDGKPYEALSYVWGDAASIRFMPQ